MMVIDILPLISRGLDMQMRMRMRMKHKDDRNVKEREGCKVSALYQLWLDYAYRDEANTL